MGRGGQGDRGVGMSRRRKGLFGSFFLLLDHVLELGRILFSISFFSSHRKGVRVLGEAGYLMRSSLFFLEGRLFDI